MTLLGYGIDDESGCFSKDARARGLQGTFGTIYCGILRHFVTSS
jgi:hypothetical protein